MHEVCINSVNPDSLAYELEALTKNMRQQDICARHQLRQDGLPDIQYCRHVGRVARWHGALADNRVGGIRKDGFGEVAEVLLEKYRCKVGITEGLEGDGLA